MNSFLKGVLVGVGVGLLVAPMKGDEMRALLARRLEELRAYLPENEQLTRYTQQVSSRVSQTADNLKVYAQQAASTVKSGATGLSSIAQSAASDVKQAERDMAGTAKEASKAGSTAGAVRPSTTIITPETGTGL
jgi:gas vesicle protein